MTAKLSSINHNNLVEVLNSPNKISSSNDFITSSGKNLSDSDADNEIRFTKVKSKLKRITESDSDTDKENDRKEVNASPQKSGSDDSNDGKVFYSKKKLKVRINSKSDNESHSGDDNTETTSKYDLTRSKIRNKVLQDKFKRLKQPKSIPQEDTNNQSTETSDDTDNASDEAIGCPKIKQKILKKSGHTLTSICDPDTSDEENNVNIKLKKSKPRSAKLISPKAVRMSAKQAMENMQKIKSESNRMLREKEVSLPYHRPKALTLKDIMNRRKPALTSDGKSLPIKMNNEQLKQYALMLEQRQKEMMELCKSDTDEEEQSCPEEKVSIKECKEESSGNETSLNPDNSGFLSDANDKTYDDIKAELMLSVSKVYNVNELNIKEVSVSETLDKNSEELGKNSLNCNENVENEIRKVIGEEEHTITIPSLNENHVQSLNELDSATINMKEKEQAMGGAISPKANELHLSEVNKNTEQEIYLHYDSEKTEATSFQEKISELEIRPATPVQEVTKLSTSDKTEIVKENSMTTDDLQTSLSDKFSDNDFTMEELEEIIENAESDKGTSHKRMANIEADLEMKPALIGTPGMVIDLDGNDENTQKKLTGLELLKERFQYFAKLKSLEDMEKDREKKYKPGTQHLKLKQELEDQIAEQRSLEWEKRLQLENHLKTEMNAMEGEFDGEDIEKIEAKLEESEIIDEEDNSSSEEDIEDTDICDVPDKPRVRNPLIDDEAEVSEDEDVKNYNKEDEDNTDGDDDNKDVDDENTEDEDDEDSSQSEEEQQQTKCRKGRILKAFEDSDDEEPKTDLTLDNVSQTKSHEIPESQDDEIQLAQPQKTYSDDLFTSQECSEKSSSRTDESKVADMSLEEDLGSQTFSILKSSVENINDTKSDISQKIDVICETQACSDEHFDEIVGMCTGGFSQNLVTPQAESSQLSQSQEIGEDVVALCTGQFYDNPFISQVPNETGNNVDINIGDESINESNPLKRNDEISIPKIPEDSKSTNIHEGENKLLKSILDELDDPEFDSPKPNKYFSNVTNQDKENAQNVENSQFKKKFVIESDDEMNEPVKVAGKKKKIKKRKLENRALRISDDEEDEYSEPDQETYESDIEEDNDRLVEYDSEENEVEIKVKGPKKKRGGRDFFEQEAELTSEDEWIGSGDEDEAGLDRMEREEGDDDTFHQGQLQRELGEIHMRDILDQDKREVRLLQELLFEDGDLGDGHRQRKFRWKNADGEEELGTNANEYADTQEDEFESEEQWRKQRHEREMFLRKLQEKNNEEANVSINRSAFIKATLASKPMASTSTEKTLDSEHNASVGHLKLKESVEKKTATSVPSPKKPFIILQQNYHNSLLTRGRGALARLAALATPLAGDGDDAPKVNASSNRGNFVFAAITPPATGSKKVTKRKADTAPDTPRLLKKMKQESNSLKSSLLDHL